MRADDDRNALAAVQPEQRKQLPVPEREDERLPVRMQHPIAGFICDSETPRAREGAKEPGADANPERELPAARRVTHAAISLAILATRAAAPGVPSRDRTSARPANISSRLASPADSNGSKVSAMRSGTMASWTNSGATSRPATTFTRPMRGIFTTRRAIAYVHRLVRYATTSGHPATAASSVVVPLLHNAASAARSTANDADGTRGYGQRSGSIMTDGAALTTTRSPGRRASRTRAVRTKSSR